MRDIPAIKAIEWAIEGNTTKQKIPGGMGLKLISKFFDEHEGCVRIVSGDGYWVKREGQVSTKSLTSLFPGTVVSLEVSTSS